MIKKGKPCGRFAQDDHVNPKRVFSRLAVRIILAPLRSRSGDYREKKCRRPQVSASLAEGGQRPGPHRMRNLLLDERWDEVFVIPDILCNALGGVIVSLLRMGARVCRRFSLWSESEVDR